MYDAILLCQIHYAGDQLPCVVNCGLYIVFCGWGCVELNPSPLCMRFDCGPEKFRLEFACGSGLAR